MRQESGALALPESLSATLRFVLSLSVAETTLVVRFREKKEESDGYRVVVV